VLARDAVLLPLRLWKPRLTTLFRVREVCVVDVLTLLRFVTQSLLSYVVVSKSTDPSGRLCVRLLRLGLGLLFALFGFSRLFWLCLGLGDCFADNKTDEMRADVTSAIDGSKFRVEELGFAQ
jgi:hypothetical protein